MTVPMVTGRSLFDPGDIYRHRNAETNANMLIWMETDASSALLNDAADLVLIKTTSSSLFCVYFLCNKGLSHDCILFHSVVNVEETFLLFYQ